MSPQRIQLKRSKGWRKPEGAVVVSRPSRWGNPFHVGRSMCPPRLGQAPAVVITPILAVALYRVHVAEWIAEDWDPFNDLSALRGHDLACWCAHDAPCHADVLLELANPEPPDVG